MLEYLFWAPILFKQYKNMSGCRTPNLYINAITLSNSNFSNELVQTSVHIPLPFTPFLKNGYRDFKNMILLPLSNNSVMSIILIITS